MTVTRGCGKLRVLTKAKAAFLFCDRETTTYHIITYLCANSARFGRAACFGQQWYHKTGAFRSGVMMKASRKQRRKKTPAWYKREIQKLDILIDLIGAVRFGRGK